MALIIALELQGRFVEEPYLSAVHGETWEQHRRRVGRFVPRGTRYG